ncbi:acyl transferase domain-containing protein [Chitinophaga niastensis]|uniref:Acyl transferase domain-containing protein n=1 Tax=Chitinophaga niastensis TaxID=536980 RepID=A0A2P8HPP7_CHINA|nr:SDR family NAD(P)-dependent oxidoreductase [Chitinophaga niastensis]PSL48185.1 acyl transferase domain-containing protein [Chitinophaga niastensis]
MTDIFQYILQELKSGRITKEEAMEMIRASQQTTEVPPVDKKPSGIALQPLSGNGQLKVTDNGTSAKVSLPPVSLPSSHTVPGAAAEKPPVKEAIAKEEVPLIPLQQLQEELTASLADALYMEVASIHPSRRFIEMGLDSIVGVEWIRAVNRKYRVSVSVTKVYDYPTIIEFAEILQAEIAQKQKKSVPEKTVDNVKEYTINPPQQLINDPGEYYGLVVDSVHTLNEVQLQQWPVQEPAPDEVIIAVKASAINFPDVMCVKGLYPTMPDYPFVPGFEVAGVITATGADVSGFVIGEEVVAITGKQLGGHAAYVNVPAANTVRKPVNVSFEEACSLPVVFGTVYTAFEIGALAKGEQVLIQTATGGCGLMAIQLANLKDCTIYGTAGKTAKLEVLQQLQVPYVMNYKTNAFDKEILDITKGRGVDVVLNMLSGDGIQKGINCLAPSGRYLELAVHALKVSTMLDLSRLTANQSVHSIDLRRLGFDKGVYGKEVLQRMVDWVEEGRIIPIVSRIYPVSQLKDALAYVDQGQHIGKVIISHTQQAMTDHTAECIQKMIAHKQSAVKYHNTDNTPVQKGVITPVIPAYEGIAVIGMSGQFPQSGNADIFWENIAQGKDCITEIPPDRWSIAQYYDPQQPPGKTNCKWMGAVTDADCFDPLFFNISPVEAELMDPQQRLFLENCWHCVEDAGLDPDVLSGSRCGVFVGCGTGDYGQVMDQQRLSAQGLMGVSTSILSARISYLLNLKGPCLAIDTACSSSLVAIAEACNSLVLGTSDLALAGGVCVLSGPLTHLLTSQANMLSENGRCFTFDNRANGYVPGEGAGVILLKRLSDAVRDKDPVYGVIRGWGINQDGKTNGITAPSVNSQIALEKEVYQRFNIDPANISLVEAHGTGTKLGDPIEVEALIASFRAFTEKEQYCALGSVKSNIGHLLTAAGSAGIIKVLKAMQHKQLPPTIQFHTLNEHIDLENSPFYINTQLRNWETAPGKLRQAAVSSFGFSGTNAHIVIEEYENVAPVKEKSNEPLMFVLSAQSAAQLKTSAVNLRAALIAQQDLRPADIAYTLQTGRQAMEYRMVLLADTVAMLLQKLEVFIRGEIMDDMVTGQVTGGIGQTALKEAAEETALWIRQKKLHKIAASWVKGIPVSWKLLYEGELPHIIHLPVYPFARERYWADNGSTRSDNVNEGTKNNPKGEVLHPLLHNNVSGFAGIRFSTVFTGTEFFLEDHRVKDQRLLPGTAYLEMVRAAIQQAAGQQQDGTYLQLNRIVWARPIVADGAPVTVQVLLHQKDHQEAGFEIDHIKTEDAAINCFAGGAVWISSGPVPIADITAIRAQCNGYIFSGEECYDYFRSVGIAYGSGFQAISKLYAGDNQVLAELVLPGIIRNTFTDFVLHPTMIDAALQASVGFVLHNKQGDSKTVLPYALDSLDIYQACTTHMWSHVRLSTSFTTDENVRKLDVDLYDLSGKLCVRMKGFASRVAAGNVVSRQAMPVNEDPLSGTLMLTPVWEPTPIVPLPFTTGSNIRVLLAGGTAAEQNTLLAYYPQAQVLHAGSADLAAQLPDGLTHIIWIAAGSEGQLLNHRSLISAQEDGVSCFRLIRALLQKGYGRHTLDWTFITRQCIAIDKQEHTDPSHAALHGLAGSLAKEYPHWLVRLVDLPTDMDIRWKNILSLPGESQGNALAYRQGQWYKQQLALVEQFPVTASLYRRGGVYVVIGGAGGIGRAWTEYMIRTYQAQVVWIGRRAANEEILLHQQQLGAAGPVPEYISADAGNVTALNEARAAVIRKYGRIDGIVQSAIVLSDQSLSQMEESAFQAALHAKVAVSICLAEVFGRDRLDFVLFFSSIISFLKNAGQSNYAAGSTFEDAFAQYLSQHWSCAVKTMNWGYWGSTGIVAASDYRQRVTAAGIGSIEPPEAMTALESLLSGPFSSIALLKTTRPLSAENIMPLEKISVYPAPLYNGMTPVFFTGMNNKNTMRDTGMEQIKKEKEQQLVQLDALLCNLLWGQLQHMGLFSERQSTFAALRAAMKLPASYHRWLEETLSILNSHHYIDYHDGHYTVNVIAQVDMALAWQQWEKQKMAWLEDASMQAHLLLAEHTLRALSQILTGKQIATDVIFPGSSMALVEGIYKENKISGYFNQVLADCTIDYIQKRLAANPAHKIRLLEIGAGTGGTSTVLFDRLRPFTSGIAEYCYTDISKAFLLHAEEMYGPQVPYLQCKLFDTTQPAASQGIEAGTYDIVIAANVLHATANIQQVLRNIKALLPAHGLLLLHELSRKALVAHLTFGLLDGWWLYEDEILRIPGSPIVAPDTWETILRREGFSNIVFPAAVAHDLGHQVIAAASDGIVRQSLRLPKQQVLAADSAVTQAPPPAHHLQAADVTVSAQQLVKKILSKVLKLPQERIGLNTAFEKYGIDSILQVILIRELEKVTGALPATLFFEYVTVQELADYLATNYASCLSVPAAANVDAPVPVTDNVVADKIPALAVPPVLPTDTRETDDIAIIGMSGRYPLSADITAFWEHLKAGDNCIRETPAHRWNGVEHHYGGYLDNTDKFDHHLFDIDSKDVFALSPETRMFMEVVWEALEDAGYSRHTLREWQTTHGTGAGVFVGAMYNQYSWCMPSPSLGELSSNATEWHIANRVSHFFHLTGPSLVVNTACSASLTAIHLACESLRTGNCSMAVTGGVNLTLVASKYAALQQKDLLGNGNESRSFGINTGFIPGEGAGVVILKPLSLALKDNDQVLGIIKGSFINHSGGRQLYNAPDPKQQAQLIINSLRRSGTDPATIGYVESAANGSALGDAIEVIALQQAFESFTNKKQFCALGAVKSNIGHLEAASGISQLSKVLLQLKHKTLVPSINAVPRNPNIKLDRTAFYLQESLSPWPALQDDVTGKILPRRSMINSFGAGGAYANLVIEEYISQQPIVDTVSGKQLFIFSAKTPVSLWLYLEKLQHFLERNPDLSASAIASTLLRNNQYLPYRAAIVAASVEELVAGLILLLETKNTVSQQGVYLAAEPPEEDAADDGLVQTAATANSDMHELAVKWITWSPVDFSRLMAVYKGALITLPKYAFDHRLVFDPRRINEQQPVADSITLTYRQILEQLSNGELSKEEAMKFIQA